MKTVRLLFVLVLLGASTFSCKNRNPGSAAYKAQTPEIQQLLDTWKSDPRGCEKKRTAPLANRLLAAFNQAQYSEAELVGLLGGVDLRLEKNDVVILTWYFDTSCTDGEVKAGSVYCTLQFFLNGPADQTDYGAVTCG